MVLPSYPEFLGGNAYPYKYNLDKAKALLQAARVTGLNLPLVIAADQPEHEQMAILIKDAWSKIGVNVTIDKKPRAAFNSAAFGRDWSGALMDQNYSLVLDVLYHSNVWQNPRPAPNLNYGGWNNPAFQALQTRAARFSGARRDDALRQLQRIFIREMPQIPLANVPTCVAFTKNVQGYVWRLTNQVLFSDLRIT
jgi:ABC-type transport system substrate-binding protein